MGSGFITEVDGGLLTTLIQSNPESYNLIHVYRSSPAKTLAIRISPIVLDWIYGIGKSVYLHDWDWFCPITAFPSFITHPTGNSNGR